MAETGGEGAQDGPCFNKERKKYSPEEEARLERQHFWRIIDAFNFYSVHVQEHVKRAERQFLSLPQRHQNLLPCVMSNLARISQCADHNQEVLQGVVHNSLDMFENIGYGERGDLSKVRPSTTFDMDKLKSTIKQFARDWSETGRAERDTCYQPIIQEIQRIFPSDQYDVSKVSVLVPGAGLGRLAWEIARLGYICQGNEWSLFMLFSSNFILNRKLNTFDNTTYVSCSCSQAPGYPPGPYPHYTEGGHAMPPNPPYPTGHQNPPAETWAHSGAYAAPQQQWQPGKQPPQKNYGNPVRPQHPPAWPGTGTGALPPYQPKDQMHQRAPQVGPKPRPNPSQNPPNGKPAEISSPPQLYNKTGRGEPNPSQGDPQPSAPSQAPGQAGPQPLSDNPGLAKVQQVMARVLLLQEDVDEFVGRKSEKSYKYLEELLTKELLVLDSVETRGLENVRQARKETAQRIQAILDLLEKKAF